MDNIAPVSSPMRFQFTYKERARIVRKALKSPLTYAQYAFKKHIHVSTLRKWIQNHKKIKQMPDNSKRKGSGRTALYPEIEAKIFDEIIVLREKGAVINYSWIKARALDVYAEMNKDNESKKQPSFTNSWIRKFMLRYDLVMRKKSTSRIAKEKDEQILSEFALNVKSIVQKYNIRKENIYNMDETAIFLDMADSYTVEMKGVKRVSIRSHAGAKKRLTAALTISADGNCLKPLIIFKGTKTKLIEVSTTKRHDTYTQSNAWMTIEIMKHYINLLPNKKEKQLLIMDGFSVHKNEQIIELLRRKNFEVVFIPAGYTDLIQPLDVSVMKPFKCNMRKRYNALVRELAVEDKIDKYLTKKLLCEWTEKSLLEIDKKILADAFNEILN